ncbi:hypothetical protein C0991_003227 [Blastosporella zonata]|nr:hypothetical protein C0991_003227 [Blastosporella zonata]
MPSPTRSTQFLQLPSPLRLVESCDEQSADVESELRTWNGPSPLHRTSNPLRSILKHRTPAADHEQEDDFHIEKEIVNRFEISVRRYRTSCCKALVCLEHISDWIHETPLNQHRCPSCMLPCVLNALCSKSPRPFSPATPAASISLGTKFERIILLALTLLQQQYTQLKALSVPITAAPPAPKNQPEPTDTKFDPDDEVYPDTEHTRILASSKFAMDVMETLVRVLSVAGLTLILFALLA